MIKHFCDLCSQEVTHTHPSLLGASFFVRGHGETTMRLSLEKTYVEYIAGPEPDLCRSCLKRYAETIANKL